MNQELHPMTQKPLNPEIELTQNGKVVRVEYIEDHLKKTGVYDSKIGHGVWRLNGLLDYNEWKAVRKYFRDYHQGWFKWGTAEPDMVIKILTELRRPDVDTVVVRHKMTTETVQWHIDNNVNVKDCITGEWLIPKDE